jgi:hypothetical protein
MFCPRPPSSTRCSCRMHGMPGCLQQAGRQSAARQAGRQASGQAGKMRLLTACCWGTAVTSPTAAGADTCGRPGEAGVAGRQASKLLGASGALTSGCMHIPAPGRRGGRASAAGKSGQSRTEGVRQVVELSGQTSLASADRAGRRSCATGQGLAPNHTNCKPLRSPQSLLPCPLGRG